MKLNPIEYRCADRKDWAKGGEWDHEPDRILWVDSATGYPCAMARNRMGAWCGYVGVPVTHSMIVGHYSDLDVRVHGGLSYAGDELPADPIESDSLLEAAAATYRGEGPWYWFGFDCAHAMDRCLHDNFQLIGDTYRNRVYVEDQVTSLAKQLKEMEKANG